MKIAIASDHAGYEEKERLKPLLDELGALDDDLGTVLTPSVDYPGYTRQVGEEVASGRVAQGLDQDRHERRVNKIREIEREETVRCGH